MSLDFLVGFTIFMLALIMVVSMVPGLLANLQSSGIDYDAVAYRTGVILVEDPGQPASPPWELIDRDHKDEIERIGLAVSKETPNILLSTKVERFFDASFFDQDDYHSKAIFGDIPYSYNISLWSLDDDTYNYQTGDPLPPGYGYIRRAVKIKEANSVAVIAGDPASPYIIPNPDGPEWSSPARNFTVRLNLSQLLDPGRNPAYRIDPMAEPINVMITDFNEFLNKTESSTSSATLKNITFLKDAGASSIPFPYTEDDTEYYTLCIDDDGHFYPPKPNKEVESSISLVLKPAATSLFALDEHSILDIRFNFEDEDYPHTNIKGVHDYDYEADNVTIPTLKPAVLEVAIW